MRVAGRIISSPVKTFPTARGILLKCSRSTSDWLMSPIPATTPSRWCRWSRPVLASASCRNGRRICRTAVRAQKGEGIDFRIGLGVAWNREDPTARPTTSPARCWRGRAGDAGRRPARGLRAVANPIRKPKRGDRDHIGVADCKVQVRTTLTSFCGGLSAC